MHRDSDSFIPFGRPCIGQDEIEAVTGVLKSGWLGMGKEVIKFEDELAGFLDVPYVVTVNSCTSALFLSLLVSGVGAGDEVICPSLTWCATANAALYLGAKPVFCDVDPGTLCVTTDDVLACVTDNTRAVVPVHFGGKTCDVAALRNVLPDNICIVEDAAHAFGACFDDGVKVGASGNLTCFSFYANKNLATGEGGAIALMDSVVAERLCRLRMQGLNQDAWKRYITTEVSSVCPLDEIGYKMNYTDLQAALGRVQLSRFGEMAERRYEIAMYYYQRLEGVDFQRGIIDEKHGRHLFVVELPPELQDRRLEIISSLRKANIGAAIHYPLLHQMPLYGDGITLAKSESVAGRLITLPISASMSSGDAELVVDTFHRILREALTNHD